MAKKHSNNLTLIIISIIAIVNALGYGIIIPLQYAYVERFGINTFWVGVLFAAYSLASFISTPIIGRLSDRFGRKSMLAYSVLGTAVSFFLMAIAHNAAMVFIARILDGISGGNISVAQAVISDVTEPKERAKWFGILGASFGFGFVFGPAMGGLLSTISYEAPFYFAAAVSMICALLVIFLLHETLDRSQLKHQAVAKLFDFGHLIKALFEPFVGLVLIANFITYFAFSIFILGYQAFTNDVLKLNPSNIALLFTIFGIVGLIMQGFGVGALAKRFGEIKLLIFGTILTAISFVFMGTATTLSYFMVTAVSLAIGNSFLAPLLTSLLSKHAKKEDQGGILGVNQAYASLSNVIGPIIGGVLATISVRYAFFGAGISMVMMLIITFIIANEHGRHVVDL